MWWFRARCKVTGILSPPGDIDKAQLQGDLERFAGDYGVELRIEDAGGNAVRVHMEGASINGAKNSGGSCKPVPFRALFR